MFYNSFFEHFANDPVEIECSKHFYGQKQILPIFFTILRIWLHSDGTRKLIVLILVDMDRGNQDLYIGTKYSIIRPLSCRIYGGCNPVGKICYKKEKRKKKQPG